MRESPSPLLAKLPPYQPTLQATVDRQQASVSLILRRSKSVTSNKTPLQAAHLDLLLMQRSYRQDDPWSGQIAFPGGRREQSDESARVAAVRETAEEMGVRLQAQDYLGQLDDVLAPVISSVKNIHVSSFVFYLPDDPVIEFNYEVEQAIWVNLETLLDSTRQVTFAHPQQASFTMTGIRLDERSPDGEHLILWGLTLRILRSLFAVLEIQSSA